MNSAPRVDWDTYFIQLTHMVATRATCPRRSVGGVLVKNKRIKATGYNGSRPGDPHCIDDGCLLGEDGRCKRTIHAEQNILEDTSAWQRAGATLYLTDLPCKACAKLLATSGIIEVVYDREYRIDQEMLDLFDQHGIVLRQHIPQ